MPTIVYSCAAKVISGEELIAEQISGAHRYYNKLIELRRERRAEQHRLICETCPEYDEANNAVDEANKKVEELVDAIRAENARARRKRASDEESRALKDAKAARKLATEKRKEIRIRIRDDAKLQAALGNLVILYDGTPIEDSDRRRGGKFKGAREVCGVYWGTYLKIESAVEMAVKKFGDPRFRRWDGSGQIAVQMQGGASWGDLLGGSGRIAGLMQFISHKPRGKHRVPHASFRLCVKTDEKKKPVWCEVRTSWTRDLPDDARIMGVSLVRIPRPMFRTKGGRYLPQNDWSLQFTIRTNEPKERAETGACGIDLGWRLFKDGSLRVAYYAGSDGKHGELKLPAALLARWDKSESIQSFRDRNFTAALEVLSDWKAANKDAPEWFVEATKFCSQWRAKGKLGRLLDQWAETRMPGDETVFAALCEWRARDVHLMQYADFNRAKAQRIRKSLYLQFAADLRKRYAKIFVEDCDWRTLGKKKKADDNSFDPSKRLMRIASVGMLRQILKNDGAEMSESANTTKTCHLCGSIEEWDQATELEHTCSSCKMPWDQDYNAAMNLLASAKVVAKTPGTARRTEDVDDNDVAVGEAKYVGRWAKRKANRSQKAAQAVAG